jgi:hypothetical protein
MIITDGEKVEKLTKEEMEVILDGVRAQLSYHRDVRHEQKLKVVAFFNDLLVKLSNFNY